MADEYKYVGDYDYQRPARRRSNAPLVFMVLMLPVFFLFGFVTNEAVENSNGTNGLEVGVGGAPDINRTEIVSPMPNSMVDDTVTPTKEPTPTPTMEVTPPTIEENR